MFLLSGYFNIRWLRDAMLVPTWPQLGSQEGAKMKKKSMQKSIKNLMPLGIDFWEDFGGFWEPKWSQVGTKIEPKIHVNIEMRF